MSTFVWNSVAPDFVKFQLSRRWEAMLAKFPPSFFATFSHLVKCNPQHPNPCFTRLGTFDASPPSWTWQCMGNGHRSKRAVPSRLTVKRKIYGRERRTVRPSVRPSLWKWPPSSGILSEA